MSFWSDISNYITKLNKPSSNNHKIMNEPSITNISDTKQTITLDPSGSIGFNLSLASGITTLHTYPANLISTEVKTRIEHVLNAMETGSANGDYSNVSIYADGPGNIRQVTYGRSQTTETGNLKQLVQDYVANNGKYATNLKPYINIIGSGHSLVNDHDFLNLLKSAAKEDPIMISTQDSFFDKEYWNPAKLFFQREGFTLPLSMLVIYDSYIQSGSVMAFLRARFPERAPVKGGNEKQWISEYIDTRHEWMKTHQRPAVRASIYRTSDYKKYILQNNWMLSQLPLIANGVKIT